MGQNIFTSVVLDHGLVQLTPTLPSIITAYSGDVVGYYTNIQGTGKDKGNKKNEGIQVFRNNNYNNNIIWYRDLRENSLLSMNESSFPVGSRSDRYLRISTNAAPILNISTSKLK